MKKILCLAALALAFGITTQAHATLREVGHGIHEDAHNAVVKVKHARPHIRVRCGDGRRALNRRGACRGHGGVRG